MEPIIILEGVFLCVDRAVGATCRWLGKMTLEAFFGFVQIHEMDGFKFVRVFSRQCGRVKILEHLFMITDDNNGRTSFRPR